MSKLMTKIKAELRAKNTQIEQLEKWTDFINNPVKTESTNSSNKKAISVPILGSYYLCFYYYLICLINVKLIILYKYFLQLKAAKIFSQKNQSWSLG